MIKAIIVDDEKHCSDRILKLIEDYSIGINVISVCNTIETAKKEILALKPDLIFLDIQINEQTGFDLLSNLDKIFFDVIFTTAYENYAIQAIKFSAFDYLLKPIDPDDLVATINRLEDKNSNANSKNDLDVLLQNLMNFKTQNKKITVQTQTETLIINIQDIVRCQSDINYTTLFLNSKKSILVSKTLKEFENLLSAYNFCRIHNSHLINLEYMKSYDKGKGGYVHLSDGSVIEVYVRKKEELMNKLSLF